MIRVLNKHTASAVEKRSAVYIGRGSPLGNPYRVKQRCRRCGNVHGRGETIRCYEAHLREQIAEKDADVCNALNAIWQRARSGENVLLMCFCKPKKCHGDIVKKVVEEQLPTRPARAADNDKPAAGYSLMGGYSTCGRGTPEGAEKDRAMRRAASGVIVELDDPARPSSSRTTIHELGAPSFEEGEIIMLARNGSLRGTPLRGKTCARIRKVNDAGARFVIGDMPGVDEPMIYLLNELGARYAIYHAGRRPRIDLSALTPK